MFREAVRTAESRLIDGRMQSALEWCRVASAYAMTNPMQVFRSPDLEDCLDRVAAASIERGPWPSPDWTRDHGRTGTRVLHVLTEAASMGGLTRAVERWIRADRAARSSVAVTRQGEVLGALELAAASSGGAAVALGPDHGDAIERAAVLRSLAGRADFVICHLHSDDVVAALAFGEGYVGPPVAVFNHADHLFWIAPTQASLVIDAREVGVVLTREARGYSPATSHRLLMPVPPPARHVPRPQARAALGWGSDDVVAVSVARPVKFKDTSIRPTYSSLAREMLDRNPRLVLCAVGPGDQEAPWPELIRDYPDRVRAVGPVEDPQPYLDGADFYIDTFPFSSSTSLLEAMASRLPAITLDAHTGMARALGVADLVASDLDRPRGVEAFLAQIALLVVDPDERARRGRCALDAFSQQAQMSDWPYRISELYRHMSEAARAGVRLGATMPGEASLQQIHYSEVLACVELNTPLSWVIAASADRFDARDRQVIRTRTPMKRLGARAARLLRRNPWRADVLLLGGVRAALASKPLGVGRAPSAAMNGTDPWGDDV